MKRLWLAALLGFVAVGAWAGPMRPPAGTLQDCSAGCTTGAQTSGNTGEAKFVETSGSGVVACQLTNQGGSTAVTVDLEQSLDNGVSWTAVSRVSLATAQCTPGGPPTYPCCTTGAGTGTCRFAPQTLNVTGRYRTNVTTCTACTYTTLCREERWVGQSW